MVGNKEIIAEEGPTEEYSHICDVCDKRINQVGDKFIIATFNQKQYITCQHVNNK